MLTKRIISALFAGTLFLFFVFLGGNAFLFLCLAIVALGIFEAFNISIDRNKIIGGVISIAVAALFLADSFQPLVSRAFFVVFLAIFIVLYYLKKSESWFIFWILYLPLAISKLYGLRTMENGFLIVISLLACVWINDTVAYFVGTYAGEKKLWEMVSPAKTWEGAVSGVIAGTLSFAFIFSSLPNGQDFLTSLFIGILICVAAIAGDLLESKFKREFGVKDSGKLLPGHGGVLDRVDSLTMSSLVFWIILNLKV